MAFDPDKYLASKKAAPAPGGGFDPDAYLTNKGISLETGPSPVVKTISKFARPALEMGGGILGGITGAGTTGVTVAGIPAGAAVGGALGLAGGKAAADLLDRSLGVKPHLQNMTEVAKETVGNLAYGAAGELTGQAVGKVAGSLAKTASPVVKDLANKAKKFAVDMTPAELTKSKPWAMLESALEKIPFSSGIIQRFRVKQAAQLEDAAQGLIENIATVESRDATGTAAQKAIDAKYSKRLAVRDKLFDRMTSKVKPGAIVGSENLNKVADDFLNKEFQLPAEAQNSQLSSFLKSMTNIRQEGLSFQGAKTLRERLGALAKENIDKPSGRVYLGLKRALQSDIDEFAEQSGGDIAQAWKKANSFHGAIKQLADDPNIRSVLEKAQPEKIVDAVISSRSTTQMRLLRKAMPEGAYQKFQGALVDRMFEIPKNQNIPASQALLRNMNQYGDDFLEAALTKPKLERLKEFAEVVEAAKGAEKLAGNPSGTAQNLITWSYIAGLGRFTVTNPGSATVAVIAPPVLAKMYLSDAGKRLITEGLKISPESSRATGIASALIAMSNKESHRSDKKTTGFEFKLPKGNLAAEPLPSLRMAPPSKVSSDIQSYKKGLESYVQGDLKGAESSFKQALKINPSLKEAQRGLERIKVKRGE